MSHAAAEACTQRLAAGRGHGYRLAAPSLTARPQYRQWSSLLNVNDDQSAQRDKLLDVSRGKAPSQSKSRGVCVSVRASARRKLLLEKRSDGKEWHGKGRAEKTRRNGREKGEEK